MRGTVQLLERSLVRGVSQSQMQTWVSVLSLYDRDSSAQTVEAGGNYWPAQTRVNKNTF